MDGRKLRKRNSQGIFVFDVTVISAEYNTLAHTWMYTLKDWESKPILGQTAETELCP